MSASQNNTSLASGLDHQQYVSGATQAIIKQACGLKLESCDGDDSDHLGCDGAVIGTIAVVGDVDWSIFLALPASTAVALSAKFFGMEIPFESDDMGDAVGELTNIVAGEIKRKLYEDGITAQISLPSVVRAENLSLLAQRGTSAARICFDSEVGKLWAGVVWPSSGGLVAQEGNKEKGTD